MSNRGTGLMWQITNPKKSISASITEACEYFREKHGIYPVLVTINDTHEIEKQQIFIVAAITVKKERITPTSHIHLWGVPDGQESG